MCVTTLTFLFLRSAAAVAMPSTTNTVTYSASTGEPRRLTLHLHGCASSNPLRSYHFHSYHSSCRHTSCFSTAYFRYFSPFSSAVASCATEPATRPRSTSRRLTSALHLPQRLIRKREHNSKSAVIGDSRAPLSACLIAPRRIAPHHHHGAAVLTGVEGDQRRIALYPRWVGSGWTRSHHQTREGAMRDTRTVRQAELLWLRAALPRQRPSKDTRCRRAQEAGRHLWR